MRPGVNGGVRARVGAVAGALAVAVAWVACAGCVGDDGSGARLVAGAPRSGLTQARTEAGAWEPAGACEAREVIAWPARGLGAMAVGATEDVVLLAVGRATWGDGDEDAVVVAVDAAGRAVERRVPAGQTPFVARDGAAITVHWPGGPEGTLASLATTVGETPVRHLRHSTYFRRPFAAERVGDAWLVSVHAQLSCLLPLPVVHAQLVGDDGSERGRFGAEGTRLELVPRRRGAGGEVAASEGWIAVYRGEHAVEWAVLDERLERVGEPGHADDLGCDVAVSDGDRGAVVLCAGVALRIAGDGRLAERVPLPLPLAAQGAFPVESARSARGDVIGLYRGRGRGLVVRLGDDRVLDVLGAELAGPPLGTAEGTAMTARGEGVLVAWVEGEMARVREYRCR